MKLNAKAIPCATLLMFFACYGMAADPHPLTLNDVAAGRATIVDLAYPLNSKNAFWPGENYTPFKLETIATIERNGVLSKKFHSPEHLGTHIDAPSHFAKGQISVDKIKPESLFGPGVMIDVATRASDNPDFLLKPDHIEAWEAKYGRIPDGSIVLLNTGWHRYWENSAQYQNRDLRGQMHFPGYSPEAAKMLVEKRNVRGIGLDYNEYRLRSVARLSRSQDCQRSRPLWTGERRESRQATRERFLSIHCSDED